MNPLPQSVFCNASRTTSLINSRFSERMAQTGYGKKVKMFDAFISDLKEFA